MCSTLGIPNNARVMEPSFLGLGLSDFTPRAERRGTPRRQGLCGQNSVVQFFEGLVEDGKCFMVGIMW